MLLFRSRNKDAHSERDKEIQKGMAVRLNITPTDKNNIISE